MKTEAEKLIKDLEDLNKKINRIENDALKEIGQKVTANLKDRWLKGIDSKTGQNFKDLAETTVKHRERMKKQGKLSKLTSPGRSNQIATGQMFSELNFKVHKASSEVEIGVLGNSIDNLEWQENMGRNPVELTDKDKEDIEKILDKIGDEFLK